jgi:hypothetical protein
MHTHANQISDQLSGGNLVQNSAKHAGQSSPRKRPRSPDEGSNAKLQKFGSRNNFEEVSDSDDALDFDFICTAALDDYEQTQRGQQSESPRDTNIVTIGTNIATIDDNIARIPLVHSISSSINPSPGINPSPNAVESTSLASSQVANHSQPVPARNKTPGVNSLRASSSSVSAGGKGTEEERMRVLQEQNYAREGEVKHLRTEKEKLMAEMRKQEEKLRQMQATMLAEKQVMEKRLTKERDALVTQLQFKEQELQEKCVLLEQRSQSSPLLRPSPGTTTNQSQHRKATPSSSTSSRTPVLTRARAQARKGLSAASDSKPTEFLSSETFLPLSQINSDGVCGVTPMQVGPRRGDSSTAGRGRGQTKARSRSISPSPSDLKKMKKRSVSDKGSENSPQRRSSPQGRLEFHDGKSSPVPSPSAGCVPEGVVPLVPTSEALLPAPERELDGAQILLLLVNQNLLRPPVFQGGLQAELSTALQVGGGGGGGGGGGDSSGNSGSQLDSKEEEKVKGLLSLLRIETKPAVPLLPQVVGSFTTPPFNRYDLQQQSSDSEQSCGSTTPTRRPNPPRPITLSRANLSKPRIRHSSGLLNTTRRPHSTANTPFKAPLATATATDSASISLLSSINPDSLNRNIGSLLISSEVTRFNSFSIRSKGSLLHSLAKSHSSQSPDPITEILKQIGQIITSYHREQLSKAKSLNLSSYESSESAVDSFLFSPKSSTASSRGSDLASPLAADQRLVTRALEILEVLVTYSKKVREQIMLQPPEYNIDSRPSSSLGIHQNSPLNVSLEGVVSGGGGGEGTLVGRGNVTSRLAEVSHRLTHSHQQDNMVSGASS